MNMKEVQLLGILAVIAGGIIVLSLWGSQPNNEAADKARSEEDTSNTMASARRSGDEDMEDWEWLTENESSESGSGSETASAAQSQGDDESSRNSQDKDTDTEDESLDQMAEMGDMTAEIEGTAPADIGMQSDKAEEGDEKDEDGEKKEAASRVHEVEKGETLAAISKEHYDTAGKWKDILEANSDVLDGPKGLRPGMELKIPGAADSGSVASNNDGGNDGEKPLLSADDEADGARKYTVKKGDTLWSLAEKFYQDGQKHKKIRKANDRVNDNADLHPGMELVIPE